MKMIFILLLFFSAGTSYAQNIIYSALQPEYIQQSQSNIIGELKENFLIYKSTDRSAAILVYDKDMKLINTSQLDFLKQANLVALTFVNSKDYCFCIFQTAERGMAYCKLAALDENGNVSGEVRIIDSTDLRIFKGSKLYSAEQSQDKRYLLLYRSIPDLRQEKAQLDQVVLDGKGDIKRNDHYFIPCSLTEMISNPKIDNDENIVFLKIENEMFTGKSHLSFYRSPADQPDLEIKEFEMDQNRFMFPLVKIDNTNKIYHIVSLYRNYKSNNTSGLVLFNIAVDMSADIKPVLYPFSRPLRLLANKDEKPEAAFDDYSLNDCFIKQDGGLAVTLILTKIESDYKTVVTSPVQSYIPPTNITPRTRNGTNVTNVNSSRYFPYLTGMQQPTQLSSVRTGSVVSKHNIIIFSFDKNNHFINFANPQHKITPDFVPAYLVMNHSRQAVFVYNEKDKSRKILLNNFSLEPDGTVTMNPIFRNLDRGYDFFPESGKQVDAETLLVPCERRGRLAFAKIKFE